MEKISAEDSNEKTGRLDGAAAESGVSDNTDRTMTVPADDVVKAYNDEMRGGSSTQWLHPLDLPDVDAGRPIEGSFVVSLIGAVTEDLYEIVDLDEPHDNDDVDDDDGHAADEEESRVNLVKVLDAARRDDFSGPVFEVLAEYVGQYALGVVQGWLRTGQMWAEVGALRWRVVPHPKVRNRLELDTTMREDLASEIVYRALKRWQILERAGRGWHPGGRAKLRTWFVKVCVRECPNAFRQWAKDYKSQLNELIESPDVQRSVERFSAATFFEPEYRAVVLDELERQLATLDEAECELIELKASDYTHPQIAAITGRSITEVNSMLRKLQRRAKRSSE